MTERYAYGARASDPHRTGTYTVTEYPPKPRSYGTVKRITATLWQASPPDKPSLNYPTKTLTEAVHYLTHGPRNPDGTCQQDRCRLWTAPRPPPD